jgi:anti-sigma factor (TIGR02949 family)
MDCKNASTLLEAYLDNELDRAEARELEAHVDGCAACRAELSRLGELRQALRDQALRHSAPPSLRERIRAEASGSGTSTITSRDRIFGMPAWSRLAAACVLAFGVGAVTMSGWDSTRGDASAQLTRDLFASHWRALAATSPVDVVSSDRHTVKPWFAGKIAESPAVRDFADHGFPLAGGRIDYIGNQRVAVLVYKHGQHLIDVFVLPQSERLVRSTEQGYALSSATLGGQPVAIVSDMDATERAHFESLLSSD